MYRKIRSLLTYHGKTIKDAADAIGISVTSLSDKLNGKKRWWLDDAIELKLYFSELGTEITIEELYEVAGKKAI